MAKTVTKEQFIEDYQNEIQSLFAEDVNKASVANQYHALAQLVKRYSNRQWTSSIKKYDIDKQKQVYYFSIEFLPGRYLKPNLLNMNFLEMVREGLQDLGLDLDAIAEQEPDQGLGNGGLGRLASDFMDSMPSIGLAAHGNGIRYRYGLFRQVFVDGYQSELPDDWLRNGNDWEIRREDHAVVVRFGGNVYLQQTESGRMEPVYENSEDILAVPYDNAMIGANEQETNNLRLWSAELPHSVDNEYVTPAVRNRVKAICRDLYPDDSTYDGRILRLRQEYFFSSAGIQSIVRHFLDHHDDIAELPNYVAVHINDTHPTLVIPELMRILVDDLGLTWEKAWDITTHTMTYTNHTLLAEALETWPINAIKTEIPRIYQIIDEINRRFFVDMQGKFDDGLLQSIAPIGNGSIRMAYLAVIGSSSVNGVAPLHSDLLQKDVLKGLYAISPEKFNNKTNGIALRRYVHEANEPLAKLVDSKLGKIWRDQPMAIDGLTAYAEDDQFLQELAQVKKENKQAFAKFIDDKLNIQINPDAIFDVQIKRLHAYKRQVLHLFYIIAEYHRIKANPTGTFTPRVHIFGAKAAPSYYYAKSVIKVINEVANMINNDPEIGDKLKVVFIPNYSVSIAEKIIPAADISEQISTAGKEASGTSNMKLMANGALLAATLDGANIDIIKAAGRENEYVFGLTTAEVYKYYENHDYSAQAEYDRNPELQRVLNSLIDGSIPNIQSEGWDIHDSMLRDNDQYFVMADFADYVKTQDQISHDYLDKKAWTKKSLANIAASGEFSSDYTVARYADEIWHAPYAKDLQLLNK